MKNLGLLIALGVLGAGCGTGVSPDNDAVDAVEVDEAVQAGCNGVTGLMPTKASLATAMAIELKRWDAVTDLTRATVNGVDKVTLSAAGLARCAAMGSSCANTKALLSLQNSEVSQYLDQNLFNPTGYREDLKSSLQRQRDHINHLTQNYPSRLPKPHNLTKLGGPVDMGTGACGPHYVFEPTQPDGSAYPSPQYLSNALYFFGYPINPYLSFVVSDGNVAIDPAGGDVPGPATGAGSCPTYDGDRLYNPGQSQLGKCCVTVAGLNGTFTIIPGADYVDWLRCKKVTPPPAP